MKLFKRILLAILVISVFVVTRLFIQDVKPLFKNLVDETIANPLDKDFLTEKFEGLTIKYEKNDYATVETIKALYPEAKEELDKLYGDNSDELTIVVYESEKDFKAIADSDIIGGYYISMNNSIHMLSEKLIPTHEFEELFVHEYTHYRTNCFLEEHEISIDSLPQWFNEGISEVIAKNEPSTEIDLVETIDFKMLDSNSEFQKIMQGNTDNPYLQSFFTVYELVHQFGQEIIPEILLTLKVSDIYIEIKNLTDGTPEKLLANYLERRKQVNDLLEQASEFSINGSYKEATDVYQEILRIEPKNYAAISSMPHLLVKQYKFTEAMTLLKNMDVLWSYDLQMLAELSLLSNFDESLMYIEMSEEKIGEKISDSAFKSPFGDAIRNNLDDPVSAYLQLFEDDLINYKEIESQVKVNLKKMYPDDPRVQNL